LTIEVKAKKKKIKNTKKIRMKWLAQCGFKHQACDCIEILRQSLLSQHFGFDPV
jgi:hypothetical protein